MGASNLPENSNGARFLRSLREVHPAQQAVTANDVPLPDPNFSQVCVPDSFSPERFLLPESTSWNIFCQGAPNNKLLDLDRLHFIPVIQEGVTPVGDDFSVWDLVDFLQKQGQNDFLVPVEFEAILLEEEKALTVLVEKVRANPLTCKLRTLVLVCGGGSVENPQGDHHAFAITVALPFRKGDTFHFEKDARPRPSMSCHILTSKRSWSRNTFFLTRGPCQLVI